MGYRVIAVTPAGRMRYLELMKHYVLGDPSIDEWHLWDNCRKESDREYITRLARENPKIKLVRIASSDGTNRSVNKYYKRCDDREAFYIKIDDDVVFMDDRLGERLLKEAIGGRGEYLWWSPLVVNNAICSWIIKYHARASIPETLSCQASDAIGWYSPEFAIKLHRLFLDLLRSGRESDLKTRSFDVSLSRFSINCIGFWGESVAEHGGEFCPDDVDDEEWLSAVFPSMVGKKGRIVGDALVSHFSFFTQEYELLKAGLLEEYYGLRGLEAPAYERKKRRFGTWVYMSLKHVVKRVLSVSLPT